jgi:putative ABC transport system permease protein
VVAAVIALPVPVDLVPMRRLELRVNGHQHLFEAMDYAAYARHSRFIWMTGNPRQIEAELVAGNGVAVSEVFANNTGLGPGDRYRTLLNGRVLDEPILGVFRDYRTRGGVVYYSLSRYRDRFDDSGWSGVQVNFSNRGPELSRTVSQVRAELLNCCGESIEMIEGGKLREAILQIFDETFAITTVLLLIALVVAALGIATTLAVLVLQRRRQLNTIRAVGGSIIQIRRMIFWEAGLIVITGQVIGLLCGFILSTLLIFVVNRQSFGWTFVYRVDWVSLLAGFPLIFLAAMLAALPAVKLAMASSPAGLLRGGMR